MARYRLRADHVIEGAVRHAGAEVGDGTNIPFDFEPTTEMEGLDDEGVKRVNEVHKRLFGVPAPWSPKEPPAKSTPPKKEK